MENATLTFASVFVIGETEFLLKASLLGVFTSLYLKR